ncbi:hemerythrin domain-containing protein [Geodermatophilus sp. URMC 64]
MTTIVPPAAVTDAATPRTATARTAVDLTGFTLAHRALRSGTRLLADAVDGIARDDACDADRQRGIVAFAGAVLTEVRAHVEREDAALWPLAVQSPDGWADLAPLAAQHAEFAELLTGAWSALRIFARCPSSGAPHLAPVLGRLADLVEEHLAEEEARVFGQLRQHVTRTELDRCRTRLRAGTPTARLRFLVPWLADQCHPAELSAVLAEADPRARLLLRVGQRRYARARDAVLGA